MMSIGERMKSRRISLDMTMEELGNIIGVNRSTIHRYEKGAIENFSASALLPIAKALRCSPAYLMGWEDIPEGAMPIATKTIPVLGDISCGTPIVANEEDEKMEVYDTGVNADFALRCKGDSMTGARIYDGDIVFIKSMPAVDNGTIAAVLIDDEVTLKRVYQTSSDEIRLVAENPAYPTLTYFGEQLDHVKILGKAVAFQAKI